MAGKQLEKLKFIENILPQLIIERNSDLQGQLVVKCTAEACSQLDGFMSAIYSVDLLLRNELTGR